MMWEYIIFIPAQMQDANITHTDANISKMYDTCEKRSLLVVKQNLEKMPQKIQNKLKIKKQL